MLLKILQIALIFITFMLLLYSENPVYKIILITLLVFFIFWFYVHKYGGWNVYRFKIFFINLLITYFFGVIIWIQPFKPVYAIVIFIVYMIIFVERIKALRTNRGIEEER